jgi:cytochrome P450 family 6
MGLRFGTMQTKLGIVKLLKNFKLSICNKTLDPFEFNPTGLLQSPKGGMWLKLENV